MEEEEQIRQKVPEEAVPQEVRPLCLAAEHWVTAVEVGEGCFALEVEAAHFPSLV